MRVDAIKDFCADKGYTYVEYGEDPTLLLVGEEHYNDQLIKDQETLIELVQPTIVLHEFYEHGRPYDQDYEQRTRVVMEKYKDFATKYKFTLGAGDLSHDQKIKLCKQLGTLLEALEGWPAELNAHIGVEDIDHAYAHYYSRIIAEPPMGMLLQHAIQQHKDPVMGIYGCHHLREDSQIHSVLQNKWPPSGMPRFVSDGCRLSRRNYILVLQVGMEFRYDLSY